ncbi:MAG: c-type cytochrome [Actinomycetota bacterium]
MIPLAAADDRVTTAIIVSAAILAFFGFLVITALGGPRTRKGEVPSGFRPGPSDAELERGVLDKWVAYATVSTVFMAVFLPVYWLREPTRLNLKENQFLKESIARGEETFGPASPDSLRALGCAECHGLAGSGGQRKFTIVDRQVAYAEPPLMLAFARYNAAGRSNDEVIRLLRDAIERGRPGTPMPTWSLEFGGPLNSQAIDDIMNYIKSIQVRPAPIAGSAATDGEQIFLANCAICHSPQNAKGEFIPELMGTGSLGPNLTIEFQRNAEARIVDIIKKGRLNYDRPSMPAWAHLGDAAVRALVNFIKSIQIALPEGSGA